MMKKLFSIFFLFSLLSCTGEPVFASTSTINPNIPAANAQLLSAPIRQNFAAAYSDINNIYQNAIFSSSPIFTGTVNGTSAIWSGSDTAAMFIPVGATAPPNGFYLPFTNTPGIAANSKLVADFLPTTSSVDWLTFKGAASASPVSYVSIGTAGADTARGINYNSNGTSTTGSQFNGLCNGAACTSGEQFFKINGANVLELTDTLWNPNVSYQGAPTAWPVLSSGALAGGPDNIAVYSVNGLNYPGTTTGLTMMYVAKGLTGAHHFTNNGVIGHVNVGAISNPNGNDVYSTAESALWFYGAATGNSGGAVISTQGGTGFGTLFYDAGNGGYRFKTDNTNTNLFGMARAASGGDGAFLTAQTAGTGPLFAAMGTGTNVPMTVTSKGTSPLNLATNNGVAQAVVTDTTSAVNLLSLTGAPTTFKPTLTVGGVSSDAAQGLNIKTKGTTAAGVDIYDGGALQARIFGGSTSSGYVQFSGAATGNSPSISSQNAGGGGLGIYSSDTGNITLSTNNTVNTLLTLKNAGTVQMNQYTAGNLSTDASGNIVTSQATLGKASTTAIASATTIAPVQYVQHVSGTTAIATITVPTGMSSTIGGCIVIIADGAWSTTTAGNIFATMTAVAGIPYNACYDGSKWYIK